METEMALALEVRSGSMGRPAKKKGKEKRNR